jgi:hypothetical protein
MEEAYCAQPQYNLIRSRKTPMFRVAKFIAGKRLDEKEKEILGFSGRNAAALVWYTHHLLPRQRNSRVFRTHSCRQQDCKAGKRIAHLQDHSGEGTPMMLFSAAGGVRNVQARDDTWKLPWRARLDRMRRHQRSGREAVPSYGDLVKQHQQEIIPLMPYLSLSGPSASGIFCDSPAQSHH